MKVLVIDDEESLRTMIASRFETFRDEVYVAANAEEAIKRCKEGSFDLILSDFNIGGDMDGSQLLRVLWSMHRTDPPALALMSGSDLKKEDLDPWVANWIVAFLKKPFSGSHILQLSTLVRADMTRKVFRAETDKPFR